MSVTHDASELTPRRNLGPTLAEFVSTCWESDSTKYALTWGSSFAFVVITLALVFRHVRSLLRAPICTQRSYYMKVACMPAVFVVAAFMMLLDPATYELVTIVQNCYDAYVLIIFGQILLMLLVHESVALQAKKRESGSTEDLQGVGAIITASLAEQGPRKHLGMPPFGCCFRLCMRPFDMQVRHIVRVSKLIKQYIYIAPLATVIYAWGAQALSFRQLMALRTVIKVVWTLSAMICLYGLVILYKATRELLHGWRTTIKFVAIKLAVLIFSVQDMLITLVLAKLLARDQDSCFKNVHFSMNQWYAMEGRFWGMWVVSLECVCMALLVARGFQADEIDPATDDQYHHTLAFSLLRDLQESGDGDSSKSEPADGSRGEVADEELGHRPN